MERILVFRSGALGDFLLTVPIIAALRNSHPQCAMTMVTRPAYGELLLERGVVEEFRNIESAEWAGLFVENSSLPPQVSAWLSSFSKVFAWMSDADGCFNRNLRKYCGAKIHLMHPSVDAAGIHATDQLAGLLPWDGQFALHQHQPASPPALALHFGSGSKSKNWPVAHWKSFLEIIAANRPKLSLLIISGEADDRERTALHPTIEKLPNPLMIAENWPISRLAKQLSECAAYVGHDTGISHLAALCSVPCLWLFGPTDPAVWAPRRSNIHPLRADLQNLGPRVVWERLQLLLTTPTSRPSAP